MTIDHWVFHRETRFINAPPGWPVAYVSKGCPARDEANPLHDAAADLLAALKAFVYPYEDFSDAEIARRHLMGKMDNGTFAALKAGRAAIAKAEGKLMAVVAGYAAVYDGGEIGPMCLGYGDTLSECKAVARKQLQVDLNPMGCRFYDALYWEPLNADDASEVSAMLDAEWIW